MEPSPVIESTARIEHLYMPEDHMDEVYDSKNPLVRFVHVGRLDAIVHQIPKGNPLSILDAGCGEGHLLKKMHESYPNHRYWGADITEVALARAQERCAFAEFKKANLSHTGFNDGFFDIIACTEVIEHIYEYGAILKEFKRILKGGGYLILTFPNEFLWTISRFLLRRKPIKVPDHVNSFNPRTMKSRVDLKLVAQVNLPLGLPFALSLNGLMKFKKETH